MVTNVSRWGNSLAIRIPKAVAELALLKEGGAVDLAIEGDYITLRPIAEKKPTLNDLLAQTTPENLHMETDWGGAEGNELW